MIKIKIREYLKYKSKEMGEGIPYEEAIKMIEMLKAENKKNSKYHR